MRAADLTHREIGRTVHIAETEDYFGITGMLQGFGHRIAYDNMFVIVAGQNYTLRPDIEIQLMSAQ